MSYWLSYKLQLELGELVRIFDRIISSKKYYHSSMILKTTGGKDTYPMDRNRWHKWAVKIPQGVSCDHCILQVVNYKQLHTNDFRQVIPTSQLTVKLFTLGRLENWKSRTLYWFGWLSRPNARAFCYLLRHTHKGWGDNAWTKR